ncbi:hypothetical protein FHS29_003662 [Saccharothrix tamanrassetensis]|uniref:CHAT domain-containing protein n=1 Tax=Saccharothrix tamanrassetensis TaxID=1051531 RepID=A0A841CIE4_9PSEU|nr:CHAT domain-containing protein [Saccharothrix tamanrassetensis]MBB5957069.1 hypothetical protein [Saccharothrix tamanrassetensis]
MRLPEPAGRIDAFRRTGDPDVLFAGDVRAEIAAWPDPPSAERRAALGTLFHLRFEHGSPPDPTDLAFALAWHWEVPADERPVLLRRLLPGPDAHPTSQFGAAIAFGTHVEHPIGLRMALALMEDVVATTSHRHHALHASLLVTLNFAYYRASGDLRAVDEFIDRARACLDVLPRRHPERAWFLAAVAIGLAVRVEAGSFGDIREAVETGERALAMRGRRTRFGLRFRRFHHPFERVLDDLAAAYEPADLRPVLLDQLARVHCARHRFSPNPPDLDRAIDLWTAVDAPEAHHGIARAALERFDLTGDVDDLHLVADAARRAGSLAGPGYAEVAELAPALPLVDRSLPAHTRGGLLRRLWLAHDSASIAVGELALAVNGLPFKFDETPLAPNADDPVRDRFLARLCDLYRIRFGTTGDHADLRRAAELADQIEALAEPSDLSAVGEVYRLRFAESGATDDLAAAISLHEQAFALDGRAHRLVAAHLAAFATTGTAIHLARALELADRVDPGLAAHVHWMRYRESGRAGDLDQVIELLARAPESARTLADLAAAHNARFAARGDVADARSAVRAASAAMVPDLDPGTRIACLNHLATASRHLYTVAPDEIPDVDSLVAAFDALGEGWPAQRAAAGRAVGLLALTAGRPATAARVLGQAVSRLRSVTWRDSRWAEQETVLGAHRHLTGEAVAAHLAAGDPTGAVEVAEQGRALILGSELDIRADLTDLGRVAPPVARRLAEVHERLNTPMVADLTGTTRDTVGTLNRANLWSEHDRLVELARTLPGLADFLRPVPFPSLRETASNGPIVLVNAAAGRADAIIVTAGGGPVAIPLPLLIADLDTRRADLRKALAATRPSGILRARRVITELLDWLWDAAVGPVAEVVGEGRVWWLPLGPLGDLPFHAAGKALDRFVSSYVPTIRTLHHARQRPRPTARRQLAVAVEHAPGLPRLPGTTAEAAVLHTEGAELLADATTAQVLAALPNCTWAHFACHATVDAATTSRAVLHLSDGTLSVEAISRVRPEHAELAYLSACSTAARGRHADEPLNLAAAFHLAGFRHVVASLWPLNDAMAAHAAKAFYDHLPDTPYADRAAEAVRAVALRLRAEHPHRPDLWATLVHSGP